MTNPKQKAPLLPERLAVKLWRNRKGGDLRTLDGKALRVLYPGRPNGGPGPDFKDALLQPEGAAPVRGDVEVHQAASGWRAHGHYRDPRYNNVVLHLVYGEARPTSSLRQDGQRVPVAQVSLGPDQETEAAPEGGEVGWVAQRLAAWRALSPVALEQALTHMGEERFLHKSAAFRLTLGWEDPDQALYRGLMEALGYSRNRLAFLELAHRVPWTALQQAANAVPSAQRAAAVEALLLQASGLAPAIMPPPSPPPVPAPMAASAWCLAGLRPQNHPRRRIAGGARLFAKAADAGLVDCFRKQAQHGTGAPLFKELEAAEAGQAFIGRDRALTMAVNVVLTFLHAAATVQGDTALAQACVTMYHGAPKLAGNELLREAAYLLGIPPAQLGRNACQQQGALYLYQSLLKAGDVPLSHGAPPLQDALYERRGFYTPAAALSMAGEKAA